MSFLQPIKRAAKRPTIHEIAASILSPSRTCKAFHAQALPRSFFVSKLPSSPVTTRQLSTSRYLSRASAPPRSHDRGPPSSETTQTDFSTLDVLGATPVPSTSIDACLWDGFHLNNGVKITDGMGVLLVAGEAFAWSPWAAAGGNKQTRLINEKGQWDVGDDAWGVLGLVWPKPDLLILGVGPSMAPISPSTRKFINSLGIRVEIQDTRNAAAQFNLLATERGVGSVAAALVPMGWREGVGVKSSGSK